MQAPAQIPCDSLHEPRNDTVAAEHLRDIQARLVSGSEKQFADWTTLSASKRCREALGFFCIYLTGALLSGVATANDFFGSDVTACFAVLLMGFACNSLGLFLHEGLHGSLSRSKSANKYWSFVVGAPLLISATAYRVTHTYHHLELGQARDYGTYRQHTKKRKMVWLFYYLQLTLGSILYILFIPFLGFRHASRAVKRRILMEYLLLFAVFLIVCLSVPTAVIVQYWALPILVMNVLTNIRGLASHALGYTGDPLLASRTISASSLVSWLMLYENYHLAHHLFPRVPSYHLKAVHEHVWPLIPHACWNRSYASFLIDFVRASRLGDLQPLGYVQPGVA